MPADAIEAQVIQTAADVFGLPAGQLTADSSPATVEGWDSIQHLNLVLALEPLADVQFEPEDIEQMKTLGDIARLIRQKKGAAAA